MKACGRCERESVVAIALDDEIEACGHAFTARLPAEKCEACGEIVVQGKDLRLFEQRVAVELAKSGLRDREAFRLLRTALSFDAASLAHLLDVPEDYVGYWESGKWPVDGRAHAVLRGFVLARFDDDASALDCLRVLRAPRPLPRRVRVQLVDPRHHAAKSLQFGSTAFTSPALA